MKKLIIQLAMPFVVMMSTFQAQSQERHDDLRLDCGASKETPASDVVYWLPDEDYVKSGKNYTLTYSQNFSTLSTLRYFPDSQTSCYNLLFYKRDGKFLFRAGFYYGNYDGLSSPPYFNLEIDGNIWATVTTSMSEDDAIYYEMIYRTNGDSAKVCLTRTMYGGVPFISSLEASYFSSGDDPRYGFYLLMENKIALQLHSRTNYGANDTTGQMAPYDECCNRIWKPKQMAEYRNIASNYIPTGYFYDENQPPERVMSTAIQARNVTNSIYLSIDISRQTTVIAYFVFYFSDPIYRYPEKPIGIVEIFIDNRKMGVTDIPYKYDDDEMYRVVSFYPVEVNGSANITISPAQNSTSAPLLNAMEVFYVVNVTNMSTKSGYLLPNFWVAICFFSLHFLLAII
ncbi:uncharacterized protein At1g24485 [Jatropha curcas]|uniref:uncharacterized protein At1g24485 n=1 Tax=Jatropha curcas TaxID=180498 RepID=UPI0005FA9CAD|nr:uncharacterized protein At1g24485 [Jatropha curcas]